MEAESPTQPIPTNPAQCDESRVAQIVINSSNAECITNQESDKLNAHSNPQCEMESGQNIQNIVLESTDPVLLVDSLSQTDSIANISSNQNELETANNLFHTHETSQSSTGKEMEIEQNDSSCTAQSTSVLEDTTNIPETSQPESSQHDSGNISHSNQDESENTQSSTKKEIISVPNKANNTSTPEHDVPIAEPSCSDSQKTLESSDRTEQEVISDFSNTTTDVDTQVPSTSGNYAANTSKSSTKSEPGDLLVEVGTKNEFYDFSVPKVSIYGENTGSRFYDVPDDLVSKPIIPTTLFEAFSSLPVFGRPQRRSLLPEFQDMKIKEFVGCGLDDSEFERLAEFCSPDNLRTGKELTMASNPGQGFYPRETEKLGKNIEEFTSHHDLNIVRKHKLRVENDTKNLYAKSDAAHRPRTRGGAHGGRTRGVRTRGRGGVGLVPEVPVVVEVVEEPTAPLPQRQVRGRRRAAGRRGGVGSSRMDDLDHPDNLRTGKELTMASNPGQGFYPRETEKLGKNIEEFTSHHDLNIVRKHKLRVENDTKNLYAKSDAAHRPRTRGGAHGGRTRGVRTRGRGGVGLVPEVPVVVEVVEEPTAPLPQRQVRGRRRAAGRRGGVGSSRMDDLDQIEILNIEDLPRGTRHETPLHQKRRRRGNPEMYHDIPTTTPAPGPSSDPGLSSSPPQPSAAFPEVFIPGAASSPAPLPGAVSSPAPLPGAASSPAPLSGTASSPTPSSFGVPSLAMFVECDVEIVVTPQRPQELRHRRPLPRRPLNDDDISNYGSEESGSDGEDDGLVAVLIPRVYREALDTPLDPEPAEPFVSAEAPAAINTGLAYRQDGASDAAHRPRTRGGAHGGRTRGVRTRGRGGVGLVPEVPVVVEVVEEPTAPLPQRQVRGRRRAAGRRGGVGSSRMDDLDQIEILNIEDLPLGTRHETPLHQKRGRRRNPIEILKIEDLPLGTRHETPLHQKRRRRRNPEMYHDIPTTTPAPGPSSDPGLSSSHAPPNDDDLSNFLNYGSEESGSDGEDDGLVAVLIPRVYREALDTPLDPEPAEPYVSAEAPAAINTGLAYRQDGARLPVDLFDFDWTNYPDPPVSSRERRTPFSPTIVGPTMPCTDGYTIFKTIWDHDIVQHIVDETNFYAQELTLRMMKRGELGPNSRITRWVDTSIDEVYTYFGIILAMGVVTKTKLEDYWSTNLDIFITPGYRAHMSLKRFQLLNTCIHFNNNNHLHASKLTHAEAKLYKIQPIITHLNKKFQELYTLSQNIALDESLLQWKGCLSINQFISNKAARVGVKTYEVCESQSGYLWRFDVHAHQRHVPQEQQSPLDAFVPSIVLHLVQGLEGKGHTIWMDNFYNSPALARHLKSIGFDVVGTLRTNRQFVPRQLNALTKGNMRPGQITGFTSGDVDVMVWRDENRVATISTYHGNEVQVVDGKMKPCLIHDYNVMMGGVDKKDQMLAMYPIERRRTRIWYKKFFRRLLNVSVLNAYIIAKKSGLANIGHRDFRMDLIRELLAKHCHSKDIVVPTFSAKNIFEAKTHYILEQPIGSNKSRLRRKCQVCAKLTHFFCAGCQKSVCIGACFVSFHS